ncbi:MAG: hypothetical protein K2M54_08550 [Muribaculaceae bacterium]|nr:hypothetical protein [Muribaculaceae bacterium]
MEKKTKPTAQQELHAEQNYPGASTDYADCDRENAQMVKNDVKSLNNNPRNNDLDE